MLRRSMVAGLGLALLLAMPIKGGAGQIYTAKQIADACKLGDTGLQPIMLGFCQGFISGVADTMQTQELVCAPDAVTSGQFWDVGKKYLYDHPERGHQYAQILLGEAFKQAFPCK